ncbi:DUF3967 domain-containing protein [Bacillus paralicheniformis]|uniref:DUF3967 domain-containing protein n=1 Tax=Bacillus paralicheniformis TaxID=1648923 RepID=UPI00204190CE|nr:DUF3967 domain-containing protein [Bacillus paralicheniformis]
MKEEKTYSTKDVAERLKIKPVTVRKYSQMLEDRGYKFDRDEKDWRIYKEDDMKAFEYLYTMTKTNGQTLEEAADHIASLYRSNLNISTPDTAPQQEDENPLKMILEHQEEFNNRMIRRMEEFERRQAQRDEKLLAALRETQETKRLLLEERKKEKKWWKGLKFWE